VLVTGAAGRIGRAVVRMLGERNVAVTALVLPGTESALAGAAGPTVVPGDARDPDVVRRAVAGVDAVVHLAARPAPTSGTPYEVFGDNTQATFTVLEAAGAAGVRNVVIASSLAITGLPFARRALSPAYVPLDIGLPLQAEDPYALSKQSDELTAVMMARRYPMTVVALRYPFVGGLDDRLPEHAARVAADPAAGAAELWAYLETRDAARAAVMALDVDEPGAHIVYVASPRTLAPYPTLDLLRRFHPGTEIRADLPGRTVPIDLAPAGRLFGFAAEHLLR
jgi:nucleoside-diphosphate-sugar epimerase